MRIMVTNDDGIDSLGLHVLANALVGLGDVFVAAPDQEYSGAGAAIGALHLIRPEVHRVTVPSIDASISQVWSVSGPPALCVMFARLGAFGAKPDLVVSGINPGANVGRSVYHSGTVGAALTARNGGIHGIAISQDVDFGSFDGQGLEEMLAKQQWESAATIARSVAEGLLADLPASAVALNVNVPNCAVDDMAGWRRTEVGTVPPRTMAGATLEPKPGHDGTFRVNMQWGDPLELPGHMDGGAVDAGYISICDLSRIVAQPEPAAVGEALRKLMRSDAS
jgi:5'-nucleotidase